MKMISNALTIMKNVAMVSRGFGLTKSFKIVC